MAISCDRAPMIFKFIINVFSGIKLRIKKRDRLKIYEKKVSMLQDVKTKKHRK